MTQAVRKIKRVDREEFIARRFRYRRGEHLTILAPTGWGKTELGWELLAKVSARKESRRPAYPVVFLETKPRDKTTKAWMKQLQYRRIQAWPPIPSVWQPRPGGHVVWPPHTFDPNGADLSQHATIFGHTLVDCLRRGNQIIVADEVADLGEVYRLDPILNRVWRTGRSMETALWSGSQRPVGIPRNAYSQAEHLFIGRDPDVQAQKRYSEIGGVDPKLILAGVNALEKHEFLYFRRADSVICIVGK